MDSLVDDIKSITAHTVVVLGSYKIKLKYNHAPLLSKRDGTFNAFIICDGWCMSSDDEIGKNYQILIFNNDVKDYFHVVSIW